MPTSTVFRHQNVRIMWLFNRFHCIHFGRAQAAAAAGAAAGAASERRKKKKINRSEAKTTKMYATPSEKWHLMQIANALRAICGAPRCGITAACCPV